MIGRSEFLMNMGRRLGRARIYPLEREEAIRRRLDNPTLPEEEDTGATSGFAS